VISETIHLEYLIVARGLGAVLTPRPGGIGASTRQRRRRKRDRRWQVSSLRAVPIVFVWGARMRTSYKVQK
jgi:hypothetical protein